ncbi:LacI family DNA-binding transcriptional regulator [Leucobacter chromiiresistens]|uniref:HTH lacI-type domain-containing protein n=1 Tax=Leucobacter chromiiresistens TaxID=1079994 RepID=A0A147ES14_9MICO|nr:LacI family DNA-binding transcriptional regulator [Leucobacter chromiiresistens]KTR87292.1 hypothetical protein NS354_00920 [Leucobacter chromiiresistens]
MKPPTIYSIASELKLSPSTVSRALNESSLVKPETRERVREVAARLGYVQNSQARALRRSSTGMIGLLIPDLTSEVFNVLVSSIQLELNNHDYGLVVGQSLNQPELDRRYALAFQSQMVDGILHAPCTPHGVDDIFSGGVRPPVVEIIRQSDSVDRFSVCMDDEGDAALATRHLINRGYTRIYVILGPDEFSTAHLRARGAMQAAANHPEVTVVLCNGAYSEEWGYQQAARIAGELGDDQTAILVTSNSFMAGVLSALSDRGLSIPNDLGVSGLEDPSWFRVARPALTSVSSQTRELGKVASELMLDLIAGATPDGPRRRVLHGMLRDRDSTR